MHVHNKRLKFNILLTTYEILLKDKVCFISNPTCIFLISKLYRNISTEAHMYYL